MSDEKSIQGEKAYQEGISYMSLLRNYYTEAWNSSVKFTELSLMDEPIEGGYGYDMNFKNYDKSNIHYQFNFFTYFGNWQLQSVTKYIENKVVCSIKFSDKVYLFNNYSFLKIIQFMDSKYISTKYITLEEKKLHESKHAYGKFINDLSNEDTEELFRYILID